MAEDNRLYELIGEMLVEQRQTNASVASKKGRRKQTFSFSNTQET